MHHRRDADLLKMSTRKHLRAHYPASGRHYRQSYATVITWGTRYYRIYCTGTPAYSISSYSRSCQLSPCQPGYRRLCAGAFEEEIDESSSGGLPVSNVRACRGEMSASTGKEHIFEPCSIP